MLQMENDYLKGTFYSEIWLFRCIYILFCDILYANICTLNKWTSLGEIKTSYQFYHYGSIIGESFGRNSCLFVYDSSWITKLIIKKLRLSFQVLRTFYHPTCLRSHRVLYQIHFWANPSYFGCSIDFFQVINFLRHSLVDLSSIWSFEGYLRLCCK